MGRSSVTTAPTAEVRDFPKSSRPCRRSDHQRFCIANSEGLRNGARSASTRKNSILNAPPTAVSSHQQEQPMRQVFAPPNRIHRGPPRRFLVLPSYGPPIFQNELRGTLPKISNSNTPFGGKICNKNSPASQPAPKHE